MSKAYPSKLTYTQYEFLSDLIPEAKPGGRNREVDIWEVLNGIFYILVEGVRWRALPGDFPTQANSLHIFSQLAQRWDLVKNSRQSQRVGSD